MATNMYSDIHLETHHRYRFYLPKHLSRRQNHTSATLGHRRPRTFQGSDPQLHPRHFGGSHRLRRYQPHFLQKRSKMGRWREEPTRWWGHHSASRQQSWPGGTGSQRSLGQRTVRKEWYPLQGSQRQNWSQYPIIFQRNCGSPARSWRRYKQEQSLAPCNSKRRILEASLDDRLDKAKRAVGARCWG